MFQTSKKNSIENLTGRKLKKMQHFFAVRSIQVLKEEFQNLFFYLLQLIWIIPEGWDG